MYFQKDYVLRMIEMMGELMRRMLSAAQEAEALDEIDEITQKACGMPLPMLRTASIETLTELLSEAQRFLSAELLLIDTAIAARTHMDDELLPRRMQTLSLYATLEDPDYMLIAAERSEKMLAEFLSDLPADVLLPVAALLERGDKLAAAEDALFMAREEHPAASEAVRAFYNRIEKLRDDELLAGGLSRAEIAEGRAALGEE